jgi:hypothetical protein
MLSRTGDEPTLDLTECARRMRQTTGATER